MDSNRKKMIASLLKEGRVAKGYTQKELAELSNISVRSIQRIENAELMPRSYTLKTLAKILEISFEATQQDEQVKQVRPGINKTQKIILSIGTVLFVVFGSLACIAQSSRFPETNFEIFVFSSIALLVITTLLFFIWKKRS
jgi:transcriptional regulator with XRE-family HTH domain